MIRPGDKVFHVYEIVRPLNNEEMVEGQLINNIRQNKFWAKECSLGLTPFGDPVLVVVDSTEPVEISGYVL